MSRRGNPHIINQSQQLLTQITFSVQTLSLYSVDGSVLGEDDNPNVHPDSVLHVCVSLLSGYGMVRDILNINEDFYNLKLLKLGREISGEGRQGLVSVAVCSLCAIICQSNGILGRSTRETGAHCGKFPFAECCASASPLFWPRRPTSTTGTHTQCCYLVA